MKKVCLICLALLFAASSSYAIGIIPKVGIDLPTTANYDKANDVDTEKGFNLGIEVRGNVSNYFMLGLGFEYNFPRGLKNVQKSDFAMSPVYGSLMYAPLKEWGGVKPYFKGIIGYNVIASNDLGKDMSGGIYWGGGIGIEYKNFVGEMLATRQDGEFKLNGETEKISYSKIGFTLGYKFNISLSKKQTEEDL